MGRLQYDLLFQWFLDLNIMDPAFDPSTFSKSNGRGLKGVKRNPEVHFPGEQRRNDSMPPPRTQQLGWRVRVLQKVSGLLQAGPGECK